MQVVARGKPIVTYIKQGSDHEEPLCLVSECYFYLLCDHRMST